jgi:hypothetical protein
VAFEQALAMARHVGSLYDLALGYERAGMFYLSAGARELATGSLQKAADAHFEWGAPNELWPWPGGIRNWG